MGWPQGWPITAHTWSLGPDKPGLVLSWKGVYGIGWPRLVRLGPKRFRQAANEQSELGLSCPESGLHALSISEGKLNGQRQQKLLGMTPLGCKMLLGSRVACCRPDQDLAGARRPGQIWSGLGLPGQIWSGKDALMRCRPL